MHLVVAMIWNLKNVLMLLALSTLALCVPIIIGRSSASAQSKPASPLMQAVAQGKQIFEHDKFGGVRTCSTCHLNAGTTLGRLPSGATLPSLVGAAAQFPHFNPRRQRIVTLEQQIVHCIKGGLQGKPPAYDSRQMTDLVVYLTALSKGSVMGKQFR
jgi:cytochrome c